MKKSLFVLLTFYILSFNMCNAGLWDTYLNDTCPNIVEDVITYESGVEVHRLKYNSADSVIYGIMARPTGGGTYPAVVVCHGGQGWANQMTSQVVGWAQKGYVSICMDIPAWVKLAMSQSTGPWTGNNSTPKMFKMTPDYTESLIYDSVIAVLDAIRIVRSQSDVDTSKIGVTGGSMGGYMTTLITGISGNRIKAAFAVYGCGYWDLGAYWTDVYFDQLTYNTQADMNAWIPIYDAGRQASNMTANYFLTSPTNDFWFWPNAMMATFSQVTSPKNFCFAPNNSHKLEVPGGTTSSLKGPHRTYLEIAWMNYHLKGVGDEFGSCSSDGLATRQGDYAKVHFTYSAPASSTVTNAEVWYSYGETALKSRTWRSAALTNEGGGIYSALIPIYETELPLDWFGLVSDNRELTVTTTLQTINPLSCGFTPADRRDELFVEDFEDSFENTKWRVPTYQSYPGTFSIDSSAAYSGTNGAKIIGQYIIVCDDVRGETLCRNGSLGLSMWVKNPGGTDFDVIIATQNDPGAKFYWKATQTGIASQWTKIVVPWSSFVVDGTPAPFDMLSKFTIQLRFSTPAGTELYFDEITTIGSNNAWNPDPADNSTGVELNKTLSWTAGTSALSHDVYFGTDYDSVANATHADDEYKENQTGTTYDPGIMDCNQTYYWSVDEVNGSTIYEGDVWKFTVSDGKNKNPFPADDANNIDTNVTLTWSPDENADVIEYDIYLGKSLLAVNSATTESDEYLATQTFDANSYTLTTPLELGRVYYWRIDSKFSYGFTLEGNVWKFEVQPIGNASTISLSNEDTQLSWTHSLEAGLDRVLVVGICGFDSSSSDLEVQSATCGGVSMQPVADSESLSIASPFLKTQLFYMLDSDMPNSGNNQIVVTYSGPVDKRSGGAFVLAGMKQQPAEAVNETAVINGGRGISTPITPLSDRSIIVDAVGCNNVGTFSPLIDGMIIMHESTSDALTIAGAIQNTQGTDIHSMRWTHSNYAMINDSVAAFGCAQYYGADDLRNLVDNWLGSLPQADFFEDGTIDFKDFAAMASTWLAN